MPFFSQVIQQYLQECIRYDSIYQNAKYTVMEMLTKRRHPDHLKVCPSPQGIYCCNLTSLALHLRHVSPACHRPVPCRPLDVVHVVSNRYLHTSKYQHVSTVCKSPSVYLAHCCLVLALATRNRSPWISRRVPPACARSRQQRLCSSWPSSGTWRLNTTPNWPGTGFQWKVDSQAKPAPYITPPVFFLFSEVWLWNSPNPPFVSPMPWNDRKLVSVLSCWELPHAHCWSVYRTALQWNNVGPRGCGLYRVHFLVQTQCAPHGSFATGSSRSLSETLAFRFVPHNPYCCLSFLLLVHKPQTKGARGAAWRQFGVGI